MKRINEFFSRLGVYRNVKDGWITGVCAGIADRVGVDPIWMRGAFVLASLVLHIIVVLLYFALAFLLISSSALMRRSLAARCSRVMCGGIGHIFPMLNSLRHSDRNERLTAKTSYT